MRASRDLLNLGSQVAIKVMSVPYGILAIGFAVRRLSGPDGYLLLATGNYVIFAGILHLGLSYSILRRVAHKWAADGDLAGLPDVRGAFWIMAALSTSALVVMAALAAMGKVPWSVMPLAALVSAAVWAQVADQVRLAMGEVMKTNLILLVSYVICGVLLVATLSSHRASAGWAIFAALGSTYLARVISFALLLRGRTFLSLVAPSGKKTLGDALRDGFPMFLFTVGFTGLMNLTLGGQFAPVFPKLSIGSLGCLRLFTSGMNVYYFVLQPFAPIILRVLYRSGGAQFSKTAIAFLSGSVLAGALAVICFGYVGPSFIHLWLGRVHVSRSVAFEWGIISGLWMILMTAVFFCQITSKPYAAAISLLVAVGGGLSAALLNRSLGAEGMMIMGLCLGLAVALPSVVLAVRDRIGAAGSAPAPSLSAAAG